MKEAGTRKIVLMGNPNVGKSVVFSRLTGARVVTSNYAGTTVDLSHGKMQAWGKRWEVIDAPGTYSLEASNKSEEVAAEILDQADLVINVVDATNLERNLYLTLQLLERNIPTIIALNLWDEAGHRGIEIDVEALEQLLKVPVVPTVALTGRGVKDLIAKLDQIKSPEVFTPLSDEERWIKIGQTVKRVQNVRHRHHTLSDRLFDATIRPLTGIPIAFAIIIAAFSLVRFIGENLIGYVFDPLFELYKPLVTKISEWLGPGLIHQILIGQLVGEGVDFVQSMGILTTGLYVPFGMVLPYIAAFYFMLSALEDSGYLPRLATLTDNVFHKLGMHGHSIISVFLGMGCNVPGALATRTLETRKQRFISATLMAISVPCMAQISMIFGILGPKGSIYIALVFLSLATVYVIIGLILKRMVKGESPEIFLEIPPYRRPSMVTIFKKTWMRLGWFISEAIPWLFFGVLLINILYALGFIGWLGGIFAPVMEGWLALPREATASLLVGFLRKDLAIGMLLPLDMTALQLVIATTLLTLYFPCVATFAVLIKELGIKDMVMATGIMILTALIVGGILRLLLIGI